MKRESKRLCSAGLIVTYLVFVCSALGAAPLGRYAINSETVVDTATGLTWQRAAPTATYTWDAAKTYCAGLTLGGIGAGAWRLPRKLELESIVDYGSSTSPAVDTAAFPNTTSTAFWSSSQYIISADSAWWVMFNYSGANNAGPKSHSFSVRCVH
jgi:hypothetical protein